MCPLLNVLFHYHIVDWVCVDSFSLSRDAEAMREKQRKALERKDVTQSTSSDKK